jgi:hypothetical protein
MHSEFHLKFKILFAKIKNILHSSRRRPWNFVASYDALEGLTMCNNVEDHHTFCLLQFSSSQGSCSLEVALLALGVLVALVALATLEA